MSSLNPLLSAAASAVHNITSSQHHASSSLNLRIHDAPKTTAPCGRVLNNLQKNHQTLSKSPVSSDLLFSPLKGRQPKFGRLIAPNILRPLVPAKERLYFWRTPYGDRHLSELHNKIPPALAHSTYLTIRSALKAETVSTYAAGILRFTQFCDLWNIPENERMPASYALLSAFISAHIGKNAGATIKSWLSGIRAWHSTNHAPWHGDDDWVQLCRSVANREGTVHQKDTRPPVSSDHLLALYRTIDLNIPFHAAVWAAATVAFFGCRRLGEILIKNRNNIDKRYNVLRWSLPAFKSHNLSMTSASFHIPWTKTTKQKGAHVVLTARNDRLCPVSALFNHLHVNKDLPPHAPLFAFKCINKNWKPLLKDDFLTFVNQVWSHAHLQHVYGHSFRIGGAVTLLLAGVPPEVVAATGGWTSLIPPVLASS